MSKLIFNFQTLKVKLTFKLKYDINKKNNHNARITNFEKKHYKQDRVSLKDD